MASNETYANGHNWYTLANNEKDTPTVQGVLLLPFVSILSAPYSVYPNPGFDMQTDSGFAKLRPLKFVTNTVPGKYDKVLLAAMGDFSLYTARRLEKSLISIIEQIENIKEQIARTTNLSEREALKKRLNRLNMLRSHYVNRILNR